MPASRAVPALDVLEDRGSGVGTFDIPTPAQLSEIELRCPGLLHTEPLPDTDSLDLNTHKAPLDDVRVRQALDFAIDRDAIADLNGGLDDATPTYQIIPATIPAAPTLATHRLAGSGPGQILGARVV